MNEGIDWFVPWLAPLRQTGMKIAATKDWLAALNNLAEKMALHNHAGLPIRFIPQQALPQGIAYEAHISQTGQVPTRLNLHDFFNALVWLTWPNTKIQLNALQARQIEQSGLRKLSASPDKASRGSIRDAATLFDENAAIIAVSDIPEGHALVNGLRRHQWNEVFIQQRHHFMRHADVFLFGHAIMEKLVRPYKAITAHSLICWVDPLFHELTDTEKLSQLDNQIASRLKHYLVQSSHSNSNSDSNSDLGQQEFTPALFSPLPVLGVPGWWSSQTPEFYNDAHVFRPKRQKNR